MDAGIKDICFVISKGKEAIPEYFYENPALEEELKARGKLEHLENLKRYDEVDFHTVYQDKQLGDGHAILQADDWLNSDHVAVLFGDDLFAGEKTGISQLKNSYEENVPGDDGAIIALENIARELTTKYGIVEVDYENESNPRLKKLKGMVEKPESEDAPSTLGIVGRYIIPKSTFEILPKIKAEKGGEIRLIDALIEQLKSIPIYGYECEGRRIDTGTPEGYKAAIKALE